MNELADQIAYPGSDHYTADELAGPGSRPLALDDEPLVRAQDTAYILFEVPDLERQQAFMEDFGLRLADRTDDALYLRGHGPAPYCYVASKGATPRFLGAGFCVGSEAELQALAGATGQPVEAVDGPGGGQRVRLHDPDGFIVDLVWGRADAEPLPTRRDPLPANTPDRKVRVNRGQRPALEPAAVERFGHYVLMVTDFQASLSWYRRHLGIIPTDVLCLDDGTPSLTFTRLDRGERPADHHTVVLMQGTEAKYMHSAYETLDMDAIGQGQQFLKMRGWNHFWGIGRHILGSQVFDYWLDPCGFEVEHYADGDVFDSTHPTGYHLLDRGGLWAWGDDVPSAVKPRMNLKELVKIARALLGKKIAPATLAGLKRAMDRPPRPWLK
jgi:catechol 2,3-dioxygenase-like lactoylglutathione lyase family enzyme